MGGAGVGPAVPLHVCHLAWPRTPRGLQSHRTSSAARKCQQCRGLLCIVVVVLMELWAGTVSEPYLDERQLRDLCWLQLQSLLLTGGSKCQVKHPQTLKQGCVQRCVSSRSMFRNKRQLWGRQLSMCKSSIWAYMHVPQFRVHLPLQPVPSWTVLSNRTLDLRAEVRQLAAHVPG